MSHTTPKTFKLSILAAAMLSLTGCSSMPSMSDFDLGRMGDGLGTVGGKTMELGAAALDTTIDLLYIGDRPKAIDNVDLALMEDDVADIQSVEIASIADQPLLPDATELGSVDLSQTIEQDINFGEIQDLTTGVELAETMDDATISTPDELLTDDSLLAVNTDSLDVEAVADPMVQTVAIADMTHVVNPSETLWDIAKATTGDANNWHVIADINNLAPDASVYVGQKLTIPADMVKPVAAVTVAPKAVEVEQVAVAVVAPAKEVAAEADVAVASVEPAAPAATADIMGDATMIKVAEGETLWDFTKRTTGDATNWKLIADKNMFNEKQVASIRPGQKIFVPTDMVRQRDENGVLIAKEDEVAQPLNQEALDATAAVLAGTNLPEGDVKIVEAAFQGEDAIAPITAESLTADVAGDDGLSQVMVSGTYYPKAVYNEADFSSSLLMRVSPGTKLLVSKAVGPWLQVETDQGTGFLHSRDIK